MNFNVAKNFWTIDRRAALRRWAVALKKAYIPSDRFHLFLASEIVRIGGGGVDVGARALRNQTSRFIGPDFEKKVPPAGGRMEAEAERTKTRDRPMSPNFYTKTLLVFMNSRSSAAQTFREVTNALPGNEGNLLADAFLKLCRDENADLGGLDWTKMSHRDKLRAYGRAQGMVGGDDPIEDMIINMVKFLRIDGQHKDVDRVVFSRDETYLLEEPIVRSFLVFRNTSDRDSVSRMYAQFVSGCSDWPWAMFRMFHSTGGIEPIVTETHGAVLGGKQAIYVIGPFGLEMNTLAISASSVGQPCFTGLQMGPDGLGLISASRLVFQKTDARDSLEAEIGPVTREQVATALGTELARSLRNEVDVFRPDVVLASASNHRTPLGRDALAREVESHLRTADGGDAFIRRGERAFNPADEAQLPFSTAIRMLDRPLVRREKRMPDKPGAPKSATGEDKTV